MHMQTPVLVGGEPAPVMVGKGAGQPGGGPAVDSCCRADCAKTAAHCIPSVLLEEGQGQRVCQACYTWLRRHFYLCSMTHKKCNGQPSHNCKRILNSFLESGVKFLRVAVPANTPVPRKVVHQGVTSSKVSNTTAAGCGNLSGQVVPACGSRTGLDMLCSAATLHVPRTKKRQADEMPEECRPVKKRFRAHYNPALDTIAESPVANEMNQDRWPYTPSSPVDNHKPPLAVLPVPAHHVSRGIAMTSVRRQAHVRPFDVSKGSVAVIVPWSSHYYNAKLLPPFLRVMERMLARLPFRTFQIFVVEAATTQSANGIPNFNRGQLMNIGFAIASARKFDSYMFHEAFLLPAPSMASAIAIEPVQPVHLGAVKWNPCSFRANSPTATPSRESSAAASQVTGGGGSLKLTARQMEQMNGFPNSFCSPCGGEMDEALRRLREGVRCEVIAPPKGSFADYRQELVDTRSTSRLPEKTLLAEKHKVALRLSNPISGSWKYDGLNELLGVSPSSLVVRHQRRGKHCELMSVKLPVRAQRTQTLPKNGSRTIVLPMPAPRVVVSPPLAE